MVNAQLCCLSAAALVRQTKSTYLAQISLSLSLSVLSPTLGGKTLKFLGLRYDQQLQLDNSLLWQVQQEESCDYTKLQFVGWEPNRNKQMRPRFVSMRDSMDPAK